MKISSISVCNVTSYNDERLFSFNDDMNILIGPNGSGKSNIQKIISLVLTTYFIYQYQFQVNENESKIEIAKMIENRQLERILDKYIGNDNEQKIEIAIVPELIDIDNIRSIIQNLSAILDSLDYYEKIFSADMGNYISAAEIELLEAGVPLRYIIQDLKLIEPENGTPEGIFLRYLRTFFIYARFASRVEGMTLSSPVFFFTSQRTFQSNISVTANQFGDRNYHTGYHSAYKAAVGDNTDLLNWGIQHYTKIYYKCVIDASRSSELTADALFEKNPDVLLLDKYLTKLGYDWGIAHSLDGVTFQFIMAKDNVQITPDKFSSGEREIVHFLIAMFALNVKSGVIIIDEPELHLHPRWQKIFLSLFEDAAVERNNQFIIATHSPVFVNANTVGKVIRVFRRMEGSDRVHLQNAVLPKDKDLIRMINSQNNEGMFFADSVVLVEGVTDRVVFSRILAELYQFVPASAAIEVLDVGGKHNFSDYANLLRSLHTPCRIIADFDYIYEVGDPELKTYYQADAKKQWDALKNKSSLDGASLIERLDRAVSDGDLDDLRKFWEYFRSRRIKLNEDLGEDGQKAIADEIVRLAGQNIFLLELGTIEEYLPAGAKAVARAVELVSSERWYLEKMDREKSMALFQVVGTAIGVSRADIAKLFT